MQGSEGGGSSPPPEEDPANGNHIQQLWRGTKVAQQAERADPEYYWNECEAIDNEKSH